MAARPKTPPPQPAAPAVVKEHEFIEGEPPTPPPPDFLPLAEAVPSQYRAALLANVLRRVRRHLPSLATEILEDLAILTRIASSPSLLAHTPEEILLHRLAGDGPAFPATHHYGDLWRDTFLVYCFLKRRGPDAKRPALAQEIVRLVRPRKANDPATVDHVRHVLTVRRKVHLVALEVVAALDGRDAEGLRTEFSRQALPFPFSHPKLQKQGPA